MFHLDGTWVASASDLVTAMTCEYQLLARRAEKAGLVAKLDVAEDALQARAAVLGDQHEAATLAELVAAHGTGAPGGVVTIDRPSTKSRESLVAAHEQTRDALLAGAQVVFQAAFFDGTFHGMADFVVRVDDGSAPGPRYEVADTKLARSARAKALLQLATYANQIEAMGFPAPERVHLWLGDGAKPSFRSADLEPVLVERWGRLRELLDSPATVPVWGSGDVRWCGWCDHCRAAADARRDVLLVAGMRVDARRRFAEGGITTIEDLATAAGPPPSVGEQTFRRLQAQARMQSAQDASVDAAHPEGVVAAEVADVEGLAQLPLPNPGDVFFDFEGDPLHRTAGWPDFGLEYLFGVLVHAGAGDEAGFQPGESADTSYRPIWAHDRAGERGALEAFIDWLTERRTRPGFDGLHVYHYAPYEITALKRLVQRYATRGDELDVLLRQGVFVDLYGVVRRSVRVSQRSYSIKKLEPLYMGEHLRESDVKDGAESVVWYEEYRSFAAEGEDRQAAERLEALRSYNEYDCLSTLRLRDWLCSLPGAAPAAQATSPAPAVPNATAELAAALRAPVAEIPPDGRTPEQEAVALLAASLEYHRRESLPFWWDHFRRVAAPVDEWEHDGDMVVLAGAPIDVVDDWHLDDGHPTRTFAATVELPSSFKLTASADRARFAIYDAPLPPYATEVTGTERGPAQVARLDAIEPQDDGTARVTVTERIAKKHASTPAHQPFPLAVSVEGGPSTGPLERELVRLATSLADGRGGLRFDALPATDLLRRLPPRLVGGGSLPPLGDDRAATLTSAIERLDRSCLAVQGPPGTGKSTIGAKVIAALVARGWKVGVTAQSHRTIEALLDKVVEQGVHPERALKRGTSDSHRGTSAADGGLCAAATSDPGDGPGWLIAGTAWDFVSDKRVPAGSLDLLVIDEAGQFSLADAVAVSRAAPRLLLLGDPQQLPQVSQARHPEPIDRSALGWLARGHDTLPPELGYLLDRTYRMRPELTEVVSRLSYDGHLGADPCTEDRRLEGVEPGVRTVLVPHVENRGSSPEEVDAVLSLVEDLIGRPWHDPHDPDGRVDRLLAADDLMVVAPFNAQVNRLRGALDRVGRPTVPVGTVDRFQGREAPVVIVSMASSSAANSPRGSGFLLSRHRLNVAISRAQHTAYLVHAPGLTDLVPGSPEGILRLGSFLGVSQAGRR